MAPAAPRGLSAPLSLLSAALLLLGGLLLLADVSPLIAAARGDRATSPLRAASVVATRFGLASTCHQRADRCLLVGGVRMAACARCTGLYAGSALAGLLILAGARVRSRTGLGLVVASLAAMALDVAMGMAWPSWDHPMLRLATGLIVVLSVALAAATRLSPPRPPPDSNQSALLAGA